MVRGLQVDLNPRADLLVSDGQPVWPIYEQYQQRALRDYSRLVGGKLVRVQGQSCHFTPRKQGLVVGVGQGAIRAGKLFAHLTGRSFLSVPTLDELSKGEKHVEIIVSLSDVLDVDRLDKIYSNARGPIAPGIITAQNEGALHSQALLRSAAAHLGDNTRRAATQIFPTFDTQGDIKGEAAAVVGKSAHPRAVIDALEYGSDLLTLLTHSDGVDAKLSSHLSLCSVEEKAESSDDGPYCTITGQCFRHNKPIGRAIADGHIVRPISLRGRIVVICACNVVVDPRASVSPNHGYLLRILESGNVGVAVASWSIVALNEYSLRPLITRLLSGESIGRAVGAFNRSREALEAGLRFCILGDPSIRLLDSTRVACTGKTPTRSKSGQQVLQKAAEGVGFLRGYLMNALVGSRDPTTERLASEALVRLQCYEQLLWTGRPVEGYDGSAGNELRNGVLAFIAQRGAAVIAHDWAELAGPRRPLADGCCIHCSGRLARYLYKFRNSEIPPRRFSYCGRCHVVQDSPTTLDVLLTNHDGQLELHGDLPSQHWAALIRLSCQNDAESLSIPWPPDADGAPARRFAPTGAWPVGPLKCSFVLLNGSSLAISNAPARGHIRET